MQTPVKPVDAAYSRRVSAVIGDAFHDVDPMPSLAKAFVDGYTPDFRPVLAPVGSHGRSVALAGGSGQAFKMAPALGRIAVDVLDGRRESAEGLPLDSASIAAATR